MSFACQTYEGKLKVKAKQRSFQDTKANVNSKYGVRTAAHKNYINRYTIQTTRTKTIQFCLPGKKGPRKYCSSHFAAIQKSKQSHKYAHKLNAYRNNRALQLYIKYCNPLIQPTSKWPQRYKRGTNIPCLQGTTMMALA